MKRKNQKGNLHDVGFILIILFTTVLIISFSVLLALKIKDIFLPQVEKIDSYAYNKSYEVNEIALNMADWVVFVFFITLIIGLILTSYLFYAHPAFTALYFLLGIGFIISSVFLSNIYSSLINSEQLNQTITYLPKTHFIIENLPLITLIIVVISIVVIYSKTPTKP